MKNIMGRFQTAARLCTCATVTALTLGAGSSASAQSTGQSGDYRYNKGSYEGITSDIVNSPVDAIAFSAGTVTYAVQGAQTFLNQNMSFGAWRQSNNAYVTGLGGLGVQLQSPFLGGYGIQSNIAPDPWLVYKFGPFYIDQVYAGAGGMYSDFQGDPGFFGGGYNNPQSDDNWAAILWAQTRVTFYLTDRFALSLTPSVYWLPLTGDVGFGLASPFLGFGALAGPQSLLQAGFRMPIANSFELYLYEEFRAVYQLTNLMRNSPYYWANLSDTTPVDFAGRYQFGGIGGASQIDAGGRADFALNDHPFDKENMFFMNEAGASLRGRHAGGSVTSNVWYNRLDYWDNNFDDHQSWNNMGALIMKQGPVISPYAVYEMNAADHFQTHYSYAMVGANARFSENLLAYAQAGWLWSELETTGGVKRGRDTWVAQAGLRHRLGPYTSHGVDVGRSPVDNFRSRYLASFYQYYLLQQIGAKASVRFFAQQAQLDVLGGPSALERSAVTIGMLGEVALSPVSTLSFGASYETVDVPDIGRGWDLWTYRLQYLRQIGNSMTGTLYYQYQEAGSGASTLDTFSEHLLFLGVAKRF